ncbi:MAG: aminotransferase class I/II-fold pyridoxal phosphate-dependent enzyme [Candidatus Gastranaerophilales bacterium]|nr:aminotransferase class I/II-fold pyridoxal phosphate-dependent enzyme [Candidatus Gastranaerophilales bacterium]
MIKPKKNILNAKGYDIPLFAEDYEIKLDLNENLIGPSPKVVKTLRNISADDIKFYPVYGDLIKKIADLNCVEIDMILPTNGADEALNYIIQTFIEAEDEILTVNPTFTMPQIYAKSSGCKFVEVPYQEKWIFPIDEFLKKINEKTKLILITTPNSPTGEAISDENLLKIIDNAKNSIILIDETYTNYTGKSYANLVKPHSNVIVVKSMSKDFAIAGLRLGYIISDAQNIEYVRRISSPFSVNVLAAKAAVAALNDIEHFEYVKKQVEEAKKVLTEGFKPYCEKIYPTAANFLCVNFGKKAEYIYNKLLNNGVKVKFFKDTKYLENHFRISIPSPNQAKKVIDILNDRKDLIIFDMDGVLVDTSNSYRMAIKKTFEFFAKKEITFDKIQKAKNQGGLNNDWDLTEFLLKNEGFEIPKHEIIDRFQEFYLGSSENGLINTEKLIISTKELKELAKTYELAIFTGRPRKEALLAIKQHNLEKIFNYIVAMEDVPTRKHKPDSWGINHILSVIKPNNAYYLGDTPDDMICAKSANIKGIGVLPPQDKSEELKSALQNEKAMLILEKTNDLLKILGEIEKCAKAG